MGAKSRVSKNSGGGKNPKQKIYYDVMLSLLESLYHHKGKPLSYAEMRAECKDRKIKRGCKPESIKIHVNRLIAEGFPIGKTEGDKAYWSYLEASLLLDGTKILASLRKDADSKAHLAKEVVDMLEKEEKKNDLKNVFMGIGTTVYEAFREMLERRVHGKLTRLDTVYTDSLLIILEYMHHEKPDFNLDVLDGRLYRGWARTDSSRKHLNNDTPVNFSITSFKGFDKDHGFSSDDRSGKSKKMSLDPHCECKRVIIPMSLYKFGPTGIEDIVAQVRDFVKGVKYTVVTDKPVLPRDAVHVEHVDGLLEQAEKLGLDIEFQYVPRV